MDVYRGADKVAELGSYDELRVGANMPAFIYEGDELVYPNPVKEGLVLWYDFSGRTNADSERGVAEDLSGNGNHGTLQNFNYTAESGYDKNKLSFDGVDDYVEISDLGLSENAMSVQVGDKIYAYEDDKVVTVDENGIEVGGRNLLPNKWEIGSVNGSPTSGANYRDNSTYRSSYIPVTSHDLILNVCSTDENLGQMETWIHGYDEEKKGVKVIGSWNYGLPRKLELDESVKFLRVLIRPYDLEGERALADLGEMNKSILPKLEKGNVATDWTPAPEDFQTTSLSPSSLGSLKLYNRPLTPEEIAHNYAIEKERFGIE